jgi:Flp pilus assembly protein TadG
MRRLIDERGSGAAELALLAPALVAMLMFTAFAFRITQADAEVADVAAEAARAASLERSAPAAAAAAQATAAANLAAGGVTCTNLQVATDTGTFVAGDVVTVDVTCTADLSDLLILDLPATRTLSATGREILDRYRGTGT